MADKSLINIGQQVSDETQQAVVKFAKAILAPAGAVIGTIADIANGARIRVAAEVLERTEKVCTERGIDLVNSKLNVGHFYPFMEAAQNASDPTLKEMWSQLLASAIASEEDQHPKFIECMKNITKDETIILAALVAASEVRTRSMLSVSDEMNTIVFDVGPPAKPIVGLRFQKRFFLYLNNLVSLGLVELSESRQVELSAFGAGFLVACGVKSAST